MFGRLFPQVTLMIGKKTDGSKAVGGRGQIRRFSHFCKGEDDNLHRVGIVSQRRQFLSGGSLLLTFAVAIEIEFLI